jgi:protein dithiol oxidoreductase (disulfide-forming)
MRLTSKIVLLTSLFFSTTAFAQDSLMTNGVFQAVDPNTKQKVELQIFGRTSVPNEYNAVRFFFTYTCPYGQKYDNEMAIWGSSLPTNFKYVRVPVITQEPNSVVGAYAYYAAIQTNKLKINEFQKEAFKLIKQENKDPSDQWTYYQAAKRVGMNTEVFKSHWTTKRTENFIKNAIVLASKYKVSYTPTLTVGGIYTLNPEPIAESKTSFIDFANALTSKYIKENGTAIR